MRSQKCFLGIAERSWDTNFVDPELWNPKIRAPICFNPRSPVRTSLSQTTEWVVAGFSKTQIQDLSHRKPWNPPAWEESSTQAAIIAAERRGHTIREILEQVEAIQGRLGSVQHLLFG